MCSLPMRISSSCRPSLFFCGHFVSSSLLRLYQYHSHIYTLRARRNLSLRCLLAHLLQNLTIFNNALDLLDHERGDAHYAAISAAFLTYNKQREGKGNLRRAYSLSGSKSRCGSWSCWRSVRPLNGRRLRRGNRILFVFDQSVAFSR